MRDILAKFGTYFLTGGFAAIIDVSGFALLHLAGLDTAPAATVSFIVAAVCNYQLSARFVFKQMPTGRGFVVFLLIAALIGLTLNVGLTVASAKVLGMPPVIAKIIGIGAAFSINFLLNLLVVFRTRSP